jgi:hypothetical protein
MKVSILIPIYNEFLTLPLVSQRVLDAPLRIGSAIVVWKSGQIALHCKVDLIAVLLLSRPRRVSCSSRSSRPPGIFSVSSIRSVVDFHPADLGRGDQ